MKNKDLKKLKKRIIEISYHRKLSHLGSALTALPIIAGVYEQKKTDERFILSAGHAHIAHAVVMEHFGIIKDAGENIDKHGIHCERKGGCDCSAGSLGHGLPIAVGMALADRSKNVYCLISDGECSEGSIWEAFRIIKEQKLYNLKVHLNYNGWGAYKYITEAEAWNTPSFVNIHDTNVEQLPFLKGLDAHYYTMKEDDYKVAMEVLR